MIIMKFGGASMGSAGNIRNVGEIVRLRADRKPLVIVSAHAGVTDALVDLGARAPRGDTDSGGVEERHRRILRDLSLPEDLLEPLMEELRHLARGMKLW